MKHGAAQVAIFLLTWSYRPSTGFISLPPASAIQIGCAGFDRMAGGGGEGRGHGEEGRRDPKAPSSRSRRKKSRRGIRAGETTLNYALITMSKQAETTSDSSSSGGGSKYNHGLSYWHVRASKGGSVRARTSLVKLRPTFWRHSAGAASASSRLSFTTRRRRGGRMRSKPPASVP